VRAASRVRLSRVLAAREQYRETRRLGNAPSKAIASVHYVGFGAV